MDRNKHTNDPPDRGKRANIRVEDIRMDIEEETNSNKVVKKQQQNDNNPVSEKFYGFSQAETHKLQQSSNSNIINTVGSQVNSVTKNVSQSDKADSKAVSKNKEDSEKTEREIYVYDRTDTAPFFVYVENIEKDFNGKLNAIKVGQILFDNHPELDTKIISIDSVGRNRIRIKFRDGLAANNLIKSTALIKFNLVAFIPKFLTHKLGIIKGIDVEYSEEFLKNKIQQFDMHCRFRVESVKRMHVKVTNADGSKTLNPTKTILVTFKASQLPNYISINHVRFPVITYEQKVLLCYNCYRYGHLGKQCKSDPRCLKCKENHKTNDCTKHSQPTCFYCQDNHLTNEIKKCPEFTRQKAIKKLMSTHHLSYKEANEKVPKVTYASVLGSNKSGDSTPSSSFSSILQKNTTTNNNNNSAFENNNSFVNISSELNNNRHTHQENGRFTKVITKNKRPRYSQSNENTNFSREDTHPISLPSTPGGILNRDSYTSNLQAQENDLNCISLSHNSLIKLIIMILNNLKHINNSFDIQESDLAYIIKSFIQSNENPNHGSVI